MDFCTVDRQTYQVLLAIFGILWFSGLTGFLQASMKYQFNKSFTVVALITSFVLCIASTVPFWAGCYAI